MASGDYQGPGDTQIYFCGRCPAFFDVDLRTGSGVRVFDKSIVAMADGRNRPGTPNGCYDGISRGDVRVIGFAHGREAERQGEVKVEDPRQKNEVGMG